MLVYSAFISGHALTGVFTIIAIEVFYSKAFLLSKISFTPSTIAAKHIPADLHVYLI